MTSKEISVQVTYKHLNNGMTRSPPYPPPIILMKDPYFFAAPFGREYKPLTASLGPCNRWHVREGPTGSMTVFYN